MTKKPKTLYDAAISYRTPSGRKVRYFKAPIAAHTLAECEEEIQYLLHNEQLYGRRRIKEIVGEFSATIMGRQIATR